jgi:hypothetical protein
MLSEAHLRRIMLYKYAVFNNYIDSHKLRMSRTMIWKSNNALRLFAKKYKRDSGVKLIHTGTKKEKNRDSINHGIADLDLRGETSVEESFILGHQWKIW